MADDTTLFLKNIKSLENAIKKFNKFEEYSGLRLNLGKTILIPIGNKTGEAIELPKSLKKISVKNGSFKALGVWFANNEEEIEKINLKNGNNDKYMDA